jgi:hypothetical protein
MATGTTMDNEWSLKDLTVAVPFVASSFAFAFVVGYFYAFDIAWFAFFSFTEHLVFALRALPIAIGGSVGFLVALRFSQVELRWKWLQNKGHWLAYLWICALGIAALLAIKGNHLGLFASFVIVAIGAYIYQNLPSPSPPFATVVFWATNLMVLSFTVGLASGNAWRFEKLIPFQHRTNPIVVESENQDPIAGHVIFVGSVGVLIYDLNRKAVTLVKENKITKVFECASSPCLPNE